MSPARILILGSGGREHALAWRLARDPEAPEILVAPGNGGLAARFRCLDLDPSDVSRVVGVCRRESIDLVVVGPEAPLAAGITDRLSEQDVAVFGPSREAARLESSKAFAKEVLREASAPTPRARVLESAEAARGALAAAEPPWVLKVDGLAAGKGVLVTRDRAEADAFLDGCFGAERFGASGRRVLVEEFVVGEELSVMAVCDGERAVFLPAARDYKRAEDGDRGPNTGGMGAFAAPELADDALEHTVRTRIVEPVLAVLRARGAPFRGLLYAGLMCGADGVRVIEFNVRWGDPEAQVVLPLVSGSLSRLFASAARGALDPGAVGRDGGAAVTVALVDAGYPAPRGDGLIEASTTSRVSRTASCSTPPPREARGLARARARRLRDRVQRAVGRPRGAGARVRLDRSSRREWLALPSRHRARARGRQRRRVTDGDGACLLGSRRSASGS
jgi:phosphoribosylamine--glycine ligase